LEPKPASGTPKGQVGTKRDKTGQLKTADLLQRNVSESLGQEDSSIFTRENWRTPEEMERLTKEADIW